MAAFDYFTQPQGPVVPISLFGDAARGGTEVGNAIPTALTAAIKGGFQGYQLGQQIEATSQQNELRANQIEQIPVDNEIKQAQLKNAELRNQQEILQTDLETQTQNNRIENQNSVLEDQTYKAKQDLTLQKNEDQFQSAFKGADPQQQAQMVLGNQYSDVFAKNPTLYKQSLQSIYLNPNSNLDSETRANIGAFFRKSDIKDAYEKAAEANLGKYQASESELMNDPLTGQLIQNTGLSARQTYGNIKFVDTGQYVTGTDGKKVLIDPRTGEPQQKADYSRGGGPPISFDVMYKDPKSGEYTILATGVDKDQKKKFDTWTAQKAIQDGSSLRSDLGQIDEQTQAQKKAINNASFTGNGSPSNVSVLGGNNKEDTGTAQVPLRVQIAQKTLGLPEEAAIKLDPTLKSLEDHLTQERLNPEYRASPAAALKRNSLFETLGRSYADVQYDTSPAIQAQYNQGTVDKYNKSLETDALQKLDFTIGAATPERIKQMIGPFIADNPKDYYYKKNLVAINQSLKYLSNQYTQLADAKVQASVKKLTATQRIMQDLAGASSGR